uniref:C2H2-type domain-containing protein n=1 Tax=Clastoptera arizonana TaxID=38151 RepID=A0A1B6DZU3_9HEMI
MRNSDVHSCGDCKEQFQNLEEFLVHKLKIEKYTLHLEDSVSMTGLKIPVFSKIHNVDEVIPMVEEVEVYEASVLHEEEIVDHSPTEMPKIDELQLSPEVNIVEAERNEAYMLQIAEEIPDSKLEIAEETPDSKFKCSTCGQKYKNKVILRVHRQTVHSIDKPFSCNECSMTFKTKGSLTRHQRRHTDERPYVCIACSKGFRDSGSLTRHLKSVSPCTSLHKTLRKVPKEVKSKTEKDYVTKPVTAVNVLITRLRVQDKVISDNFITTDNSVNCKVIELTLEQQQKECDATK